MIEKPYKPYFTVADTYLDRGHLILVAEHEDLSGSGFTEQIEIRRAGAPVLRVEAAVVQFWGRDPEIKAPLCLAVKGLECADVPVGSEVWRQEVEVVQRGRKRYEKIVSAESISERKVIPCPPPIEESGIAAAAADKETV